MTSDYSGEDIRQCKLRDIVQWNRSVFLHIVKVTGGTKTKELSQGGAEATQRPEGTDWIPVDVGQGLHVSCVTPAHFRSDGCTTVLSTDNTRGSQIKGIWELCATFPQV